MTPSLQYLAYTALLTGSLWLPYVTAQSITNGPLRTRNYQDPTQRPLPHWGRRADRAHLNAVESLAPFAALIIVAVLTGKDNATTALCAKCFFWLRVTHAVVYLLGIPYVRTAVFTLGYFAVVGIFWQVVA